MTAYSCGVVCRRSHASRLVKTAGRVDDLETFASTNPKRIKRRVKNKVVGWVLGRAGLLALALEVATSTN